MAMPLLLPLLFSAGSIGANMIGARKRDQAQASAMAAERARQAQLDNEAFALNAAARDRYTDTTGQMQDRQTDLASLYRDATEAPPAVEMPAMPESQSDIVTSRVASEQGKARGETEDRANRMASFQSFGDLMGDFSLGQGRDAQSVGMLGGFKRGSQGVLPLELDAAAQKGQGWLMLGDLLNMGAGLTLPGALAAKGSAAQLFGGNTWGTTPWR